MAALDRKSRDLLLFYIDIKLYKYILIMDFQL
ncbi:hypothetical protein HCH_04137 [Hahella chejuensis KCTC 2396]|uniref:Uncharacterized protein n=1 Tax=Hahella chejuensis (strain KCTC 2396) TaxID=349521 RepID=Q2SES7_HAHCH|nr:hypothetical protein HCH_04137 [Hahella chejuensis KCTC 2396]